MVVLLAILAVAIVDTAAISRIMVVEGGKGRTETCRSLLRVDGFTAVQ